MDWTDVFGPLFELFLFVKLEGEASVIIYTAVTMLRQCLLQMEFTFPTTRPQDLIVMNSDPSESELMSLTGFPHFVYMGAHIYL